jgi:hypothetical protein
MLLQDFDRTARIEGRLRARSRFLTVSFDKRFKFGLVSCYAKDVHKNARQLGGSSGCIVSKGRGAIQQDAQIDCADLPTRIRGLLDQVC